MKKTSNSKGILFNTEQVRAILDGRKTVTRRVIRPQPQSRLAYVCMGRNHGTWGYPGKDAWKYWEDESFQVSDSIVSEELDRRWTPPCHTDDVLYVRETWTKISDCTQVYENVGQPDGYLYRADWHNGEHPAWRSSIHMPREAARVFLRVTDVRVERLQDIMKDTPGKNNQIVREGYTYGCDFIAVWQRTIRKSDLDRYGWAANPWCWVIMFERITKEEAGNG